MANLTCSISSVLRFDMSTFLFRVGVPQVRYTKMEEPEALEHWLDKRGMKDARKRFVVVFNNRDEGADAACAELRTGSLELGQWMEPLRRLVLSCIPSTSRFKADHSKA